MGEVNNTDYVFTVTSGIYQSSMLMCYKHIIGQVYNPKTLVLGSFQSAWSKGETVLNQWQGHGWHMGGKRRSSLDHSEPTDGKEVNAASEIKLSESTGCCRKHQQACESQNRTTGQRKVGWSDDGGSRDFWQKKGNENEVRWVLIMLGLIRVCCMPCTYLY